MSLPQNQGLRWVADLLERRAPSLHCRPLHRSPVALTYRVEAAGTPLAVLRCPIEHHRATEARNRRELAATAVMGDALAAFRATMGRPAVLRVPAIFGHHPTAGWLCREWIDGDCPPAAELRSVLTSQFWSDYRWLTAHVAQRISPAAFPPMVSSHGFVLALLGSGDARRHAVLASLGSSPSLERLASETFALVRHYGVRWGHNDLHAKNMVRTPEGTIALIDWEYAGFNTPFWDAACLRHALGGNRACDTAQASLAPFSQSGSSSTRATLDRLRQVVDAGWHAFFAPEQVI